MQTHIHTGIAATQGRKWLHDQAIVEAYGPPDGPATERRLKITVLKTLRAAGVEEPPGEHTAPGAANTEKLACNVARAKQAIAALGECNKWEHFTTLTIAPDKWDRTDLRAYWASLGRWLARQKVQYLLIPERHADGQAWHMHGLLSGVPPETLHEVQAGEMTGAGIRAKVDAGHLVYDWPAYRARYGWCELEPVRSRQAVAAYCTKYATKDLARSVSQLGAHMYYRSRGLCTPAKIATGPAPEIRAKPAYENDYCKVYWVEDTPANRAQLREQLMLK